MTRSKRTKQAGIELNGVSVVTTFTAEAGLLAKVENEVVVPVRAGSGYKCNRSRVLQAMLTLAANAAAMIQYSEIRNLETLTLELKRAIIRSGEDR